MSRPALRRATYADIPRLMEIRSAVRENRLGDPNSVLAKDYVTYSDGGGMWVSDDGGRIVGFAAGNFEDGSIWALFVDPANEGRGIGRALLDHVCADLLQQGRRLIVLSTSPNTRAERFYRRHGWESVGMNIKSELIFHKRI